MADPFSQLSDSDLQALANNNLNAMSDQGLQIIAASDNSSELPPPTPPGAPETPEPLGHKIIREGLPLAGTIGGGMLGEGIASVPLAAAGNVAGGEAAGWLNHEIYGDQAPTYNSLDDAKRIGEEAATGAVAELGGKAIGAGASMAGDAISNAAAKTAAEAAPTVTKQVDTGLLDAYGQPLNKTVTESAPTPAPQQGIGSKIGQIVKNHATDLISSGIGAAAYGLPGAIGGPIIKRVIAPVVEKPIAASVDGISSVLSKTPQFFGKWAPSLLAASARGGTSLGASIYVLQQQDPAFRQKMQELNNAPSLTEADASNGYSP